MRFGPSRTPHNKNSDFVVHYANQHKLNKAAETVARYRDNPDTDFHLLAATITGLIRADAKAVNFGKIYGAGVKKFAAMIVEPLAEAQEIYDRYDRELPFLRQLSRIHSARAGAHGHIVLYDDARRHFDRFAPGGKWQKGAGPVPLEEAKRRLNDPDHPWYKRAPLYRADVHTALNALIEGSAARHTKLWMLACWREGVVPLLQMHDCLDCSVSTGEQADLVARLGEEAVKLDVPMKVDLKYGRNWGDAKHPWEELRQTTSTTISVEHQTSIVVEIPEEDKASIFGISVDRELVSLTGEANLKGAAEDEFEEEGFEVIVSTASVKPSTVTGIEAINIKVTSLGIAPLVPRTDTPFSKGTGQAEEGSTGEIENTDSNIASKFLASMFGATTAAPVWVSSLANADAKGHAVGERHVTTRERDAIEAFLRKWDCKNCATYFRRVNRAAGRNDPE